MTRVLVKVILNTSISMILLLESFDILSLYAILSWKNYRAERRVMQSLSAAHFCNADRHVIML
jgi:hypothetical protein